MGKAKPDRRVARTQLSLHKALNTLVVEKGYEETTIADIVGHANVGRATFYAHHGSKEGLLLSGLQHLRTLLVNCQRESFAASNDGKYVWLSFSLPFFEHIHGYKGLLQALEGNSGGSAVNQGIRRLLTELVRNEVDRKCTSKQIAGIPSGAAIQFTVDAFFSVLLWWSEQGRDLSPAEIDAIFRRFAFQAFTRPVTV